jgi:hypothetical protein
LLALSDRECQQLNRQHAAFQEADMKIEKKLAGEGVIAGGGLVGAIGIEPTTPPA